MKGLSQRLWSLFSDFALTWSRAEGSLNAAALAYYSIFSLPPALAIVAVAAAFVLGPTATRGELAPGLTEMLPAEAAQMLQMQIVALDPTSEGLPALALGALGLAWGGSRGLAVLRRALDALWDFPVYEGSSAIHVARHFFLARGVALGLLVTTGFIVAALLSLEALLRPIVFAVVPDFALQTQPLVNETFALFALALLLVLTYVLLPTRPIPWRAAWPGAVLAALAIALGRRALALVLALTGVTSAFGAAASVIVLVLWFNFAAQIILAGACLGVVLHGRQGGPRIAEIEGLDRRADSEEREDTSTAVHEAQ